MKSDSKVYAAIDLKSFYASVECALLNLNPLTTNLVVADESRTDKTICLAISPSLKKYGLGGRARLFEVKQKIEQVNLQRLKKNKKSSFNGSSFNDEEIVKNDFLKVDFIIAKPKMATYMEISTKIYQVYLRYVSKEDIHVYSIDEVFIDITPYLKLYKMTAHDFTMKLVKEVLKETGITATCGIGTNLYLAKVAMDIVAKHMDPDIDGVRIAYLDEKKYREELWNYKPLTAFWRVGKGIAKRLEKKDIHTMGDLARYSLKNEDLLFDEFGINAELLIDHAWGYETTTMKDIKNYKPSDHSLSHSQVLHRPYNYIEARLITSEMSDTLSFELLEKDLVTNLVFLLIDYDVDYDTNLYDGDLVIDYLGRIKPKFSKGQIHIEPTSNTKDIVSSILKIYDKVINKDLFIRRITVGCLSIPRKNKNQFISNQISIFDLDENDSSLSKIDKEKERKVQIVRMKIMKKFGKNSIVKGSSLLKESTLLDRNKEIGGHKA